MATNVALYIHVPFCLQKCSYCSFVSYTGRLQDAERYIQTVINEISKRAGRRKVKSIYFGGGTPSLIPAGLLERLMENLKDYYSQGDAIEVSLEVNPGTVNEEYLKAIKSYGINRLSIGVQSLDNKELGRLGRLHDASAAVKVMKSARSAGFDNINIDLIYGIPGQSLRSWRRTLEGVVSMEPEHLSLYGLSLEPGTAMLSQIESGKLPQTDPDLSADQYEMAEKMLEKQGYRHYEISNWAKPGYECRHNLAYWRHEEYIGAGASACSYLNNHRFTNCADLDKYMAGFESGAFVEKESDEVIDRELASAEAAILALRLDSGINIENHNRDYNTNLLAVYNTQIKELAGFGLLENNGVNIKLTNRGRLLGNEVFWRFLPERNEQDNRR